MFLCVFALALSVPAVHADEPGELAVEVRTYDNMSVAVMPGRVFYSPVPVKFIPQGSGQMSYSISTDDGATFGSYIKMNNEDVMLYPLLSYDPISLRDWISADTVRPCQSKPCTLRRVSLLPVSRL